MAESPEQDLDLGKIFAVFWGYRGLIAAILFLSACLGYGIGRLIEPLYESKAKFLTKTDNSQGSGLSDLMALAGVRAKAGSSTGPDAYIDEIILGDEIFLELVRRRWPHGKDSARLRDIWKLVPDTAKPGWEYAFERSQVDHLRGEKRIKVEKGKTNPLVSLSVSFESPELSLAIASFILDYVNDYTLNRLVTQARQNRKFIQERIGETKRDLEQAEQALKVFRLRNMSISSPELQLEFARLTRNQKVQEEIYLEMVKQLELAKIEEHKQHPLVEVVAKPALAIYPAWPDRKLILAAAVGLGFFAALFLAGLVHLVRRRTGRRA
jgi:uncharacterized protein involved in exopolysaccharide biosynthesis